MWLTVGRLWLRTTEGLILTLLLCRITHTHTHAQFRSCTHVTDEFVQNCRHVDSGFVFQDYLLHTRCHLVCNFFTFILFLGRLTYFLCSSSSCSYQQKSISVFSQSKIELLEAYLHVRSPTRVLSNDTHTMEKRKHVFSPRTYRLLFPSQQQKKKMIERRVFERECRWSKWERKWREEDTQALKDEGNTCRFMFCSVFERQSVLSKMGQVERERQAEPGGIRTYCKPLWFVE